MEIFSAVSRRRWLWRFAEKVHAVNRSITLGRLGLSPLYKYHAALTMHRYTLIEQSNILIEQSS